MINKLKADFKRIFERESEEVFFSPGRVNLIGEHTDYNGGHVFPCALSFGTYGVVAKRNDKNVLKCLSLIIPCTFSIIKNFGCFSFINLI